MTRPGMTPDSQLEDFASVPNIEELLAQVAPAQTPAEALGHAPTIETLIGALDSTRTVDVLAGLMTEPRLQANGTRLEWAIRMVLALASGHRRPKPAELSRLLNNELKTARVNRLEDPIEDFFVEPCCAVAPEEFQAAAVREQRLSDVSIHLGTMR
jgi:hypothetical protein